MRNVGWDEHGGRLPLPEEEGGIGRYALPKTGKFGERKRLYDDEPHTFPFYDQMKDEYEAAGHLGPEWNEDHTKMINPHPVGENPRLTARRYFKKGKMGTETETPITREEFDGEDPRDTARRYYERRFGHGPKTSREVPYMFGRGDKNSRQRLFGWADDKE